MCFSFILLFISIQFFFSDKRAAIQAAKQFYEFEQKGEFSSSWEMFHPFMKERFNKGYYIQDRSHVFMNHFGVETFQFELSKPKKVNDWKMTKNSKPIDGYKLKVIQTYIGKYGNFQIHQDVFITNVNGEWKILWSYQ